MPTVNPGGNTFAEIIAENVDVPDYQREFAWKVSTAESLINDMFEHFKSHDQFANVACDQFFLGNLITVGNYPIQLVDGQQRFTALSVMSVLIRDIWWEEGRYAEAFDIDEAMIFDENTGVYGLGLNAAGNLRGRYRLRPRANPPGIPGTDSTCPRKNMEHLCSIDFSEGEYAQVEVDVNSGNAVTIDLHEIGELANPPPPPKWKIREGLVVEFSGGATLKISHPIAIGGNANQLQGDLDQDVVAGEIVTITYGTKPPPAPHASKPLAKVVEKYREKIHQFLDTNPPPVGVGAQVGAHLLGRGSRMDQLSKGLSQTKFTWSQFQQPGPGLQYFGKINDGAKRENLSTLDLLRALVFEVRDGAPRLPGQNPNQIEDDILEEWLTLEKELLLKQNKKLAVAKDFFYYLLICDGHFKDDGNRHNKGHEYPVIKKEYFPYKEYVGWEKAKVLTNLQYINKMANIYLEAIDFPWHACPQNREHEEFYLQALYKSKMKQHIPLYMVARKKFDTIMHADTKKKSMVSLLRMMNYLNLRSTTIPGLLDEQPLKPGEFYGKIDSFIETINRLPVNAVWTGVNGVKNALNSILWADGIGGMVANFDFENVMPRAAATPLTAHANLLQMKSEQAPKIHYILGLLEFKYQGGGRLQQVFKGSTHVEHILPETYDAAQWGPAVAGGGFTNAEHEGHLQRLANKVLLEYSINDHFHNRSYRFKLNHNNTCGAQCGNHLPNSVFEQVRNNPNGLIHKHSTTWSVPRLELRARQLADDLVQVMDPRKLIGPVNKNL